MINIIETALREKYTFEYKTDRTRCILTLQELYDFDVTDLNTVYQGLIKIKKDFVEGSLLEQKSRKEQIVDNKIMIVKHIFETKVKEAREAEERMIRKKDLEKRRNKLEQARERKEEGIFDSLSIEDIDKELEKLKQQ
jgi:hypothetical protein